MEQEKSITVDVPSVISVSEVRYQLGNARIYDIKTSTLSVHQFRNSSPEPVTTTISVQYDDIKRSMWASSAGVVLSGTVVNLLTAKIPVLESSETVIVSPDRQFNDRYIWASTVRLDTQVSSQYTVTVPPMSTVKVSLEATQGSVDVPFTYLVRKTETHVVESNDGAYTGTNLFSFEYTQEQTDFNALEAVEISN